MASIREVQEGGFVPKGEYIKSFAVTTIGDNAPVSQELESIDRQIRAIQLPQGKAGSPVSENLYPEYNALLEKLRVCRKLSGIIFITAEEVPIGTTKRADSKQLAQDQNFNLALCMQLSRQVKAASQINRLSHIANGSRLMEEEQKEFDTY